MARRRSRDRRPVAAIDYADDAGNVLRVRESLSAGSIAKIRAGSAAGASSADDDWRRRTEMLFERLVVSWEIEGLPLTDQSMLLGRYRMADAPTHDWVRRTLADHVAAHIPELDR